MINFIILIKYWSILELINWILYLIIYINILTPRFLYIKQKDTEKIIERVDKLELNELVYVIKCCIIYNKNTHEEVVDQNTININDLTINEISNIIGYSLFGIDIKKIKTHSKYQYILKLIKKIEKILDIKFKYEETDRYLYRKWGSNFIKFSFRPLFIQIPIRLIINYIHYFFTWKKKFNYHVCTKTKISYLYKLGDPSKETIFFIHGFGFGYIPYIKSILALETKYNIIVIIMPNISTYRFYDELTSGIYFPIVTDIKDSIFKFLNEKNILSCVIISHSFGTYIARMLQLDSRSNIFSNIIMIDPIIFWIGCFKMSLHISNPLVRKESFILYLQDIIINYLIYKCIYHKYVSYRIMFGPDFWIYTSSEFVNSKLILILEKNDYVIPAELIYNKIKDKINNNCYYIEDDDALHGTIVTEEKYLPRLLNIIDKIINQKN